MFSIDKIIEEEQKFLSGVDSYVDWMKRTVPVQMSLPDILSLNKDGSVNQNPVYPHNIQNIAELIKTDLERLSSIKAQLEVSKTNPVIKNDKFKMHILKKILKKIDNIFDIYSATLKDVPYLTIDK